MNEFAYGKFLMVFSRPGVFSLNLLFKDRGFCGENSEQTSAIKACQVLMDSLEDNTKKKDASGGTQLSLDLLVEEHFEYLYRYAFRYFRSQDKAEDLVQDTFLAATVAIKRFEGNSSPRTWLTGILRHKIMDRLRTKDREAPLDFDSSEREGLIEKLFNAAEHWHNETGPVMWGADPSDVMEQREFLSAVEQCLSKLPAKVRQIFLMREMEGFDRNEICKDFNLTSTNVGVILHRARLSLQNCLQTNWFHGSVRGVTS